jgi:hypothetical protein
MIWILVHFIQLWLTIIDINLIWILLLFFLYGDICHGSSSQNHLMPRFLLNLLEIQ